MCVCVWKRKPNEKEEERAIVGCYLGKWSSLRQLGQNDFLQNCLVLWNQAHITKFKSPFQPIGKEKECSTIDWQRGRRTSRHYISQQCQCHLSISSSFQKKGRGEGEGSWWLMIVQQKVTLNLIRLCVQVENLFIKKSKVNKSF